MLLSDTKQILQKYNLWAKKSLGQNFLISENALEKIVETANIEPGEHIVEIGPGLGVLTKELTARARKVTSIELDRELSRILQELIHAKNLTILNQDALTFTPPKTPYKVVANIPYNITSPLLNHFLQAENKPQTMTLLIQKEVAKKICHGAAASPQGPLRLSNKTKQSVLSLQVALFGTPHLIKTVPKTAFYPIPKVDSTIIHIKIHKKTDENYIPDEQALKILKTAKLAFSQRRKKLSNTLPELKTELKNLGLSDKRPQHLSITDWQNIVS